MTVAGAHFRWTGFLAPGRARQADRALRSSFLPHSLFAIR